MAKIILKCLYLKPGSKKHSSNLVSYIATRDGVDKIDDSWKYQPVSKRQQSVINDLLKDFPDCENSHEYQDYLHEQSKGNASEFIARTIEDNYDQISTKDNYVRYIAYRPGAESFGTHGLFTAYNVPINLQDVADEVSMHSGRVWTNIISIRREDAVRLGFDNGEAWRDLLRGQVGNIADSMKIPVKDLRWYAAFHNESHHPHVHMIAYSVGKEPYLSKQGIQNMKSSFAREIFKQDLLQIYEEQTQYRNTLSEESRARMQKIIADIQLGIFENAALLTMIQELSSQLKATKGKKVYGYLAQPSRDLVNNIVDELAKDPRLAELYELWYAQRDKVISTYQDRMEGRLPLSQNKTFHSIRNIVVSEVLNLPEDIGDMSFQESIPEHILEHAVEADEAIDSDMPEVIHTPSAADCEPIDEIPSADSDAESSKEGFNLGSNHSAQNHWWTPTYKQARKLLYGSDTEPPDFDAAYPILLAEAKTGNGLAMHEIGKLTLLGLDCEKNEELAHSWFAEAHNAFLQMEKKDKKPSYWQYRIGKLYSYGYGVPQDYTSSAKWFAKAVENGNSFAAYSLGSQYHRGQGVEKNPEEAYQLFYIAATDVKKPNAYAQYQLGKMCSEGVGTEVDPIVAASWYRQAYQGFLNMEQTSADDKLYYRLGSMNLSGTGTEVDLRKAREYFEKAAELENPDALYGLGKLYLRNDFDGYDTVQATHYLEEAARKGHAYAQYLWGKLLLRGEVIPQNIADGIQWLEKSAAQDNAYAQYLLGKTYLQGNLVSQDSSKATVYLERAAAQGNLFALYTLGKAYLSGDVLPQNISRGIELLTEAAESNMDMAQYALAKLYLADELVPMDTEKALYWLWKAVEKKNQYAQYQLGKMYLYGQGAPQDVDLGKALLASSAEQGNIYAQRILVNYGRLPVSRACFRLLSAIVQMMRDDLEKEQTQKMKIQVDKKQRQKIAEKKQAQGLRLG